MEILKSVGLGALVLGSIFGFLWAGVTYWNIVGPFLITIGLLAMCYTIGDTLRC